MMFDFDPLDNPKPLSFYLCRPDGSIECQLNGVDETSASLTVRLNNQSELSFDYLRYLDAQGTQVESNGYHRLAVGMLILVEKFGYFKMNYPPEKFDGSREAKSVTACSIECELEHKDLVGFKVNTGEEDSLEYLVTYEENEPEPLLDPYTGIPYDFIVFYNTYPEQIKDFTKTYHDGIYTSSDSIKEIRQFCERIPRIKRKLTTDEKGNLIVRDCVSYTYGADGKTVVKIRLSGFEARARELTDFYAKYRSQLSLLCLALENCSLSWSVGEVDASLQNKKFQFDVDAENIYSFLTGDVAQAAQCVFTFDLWHKRILATPAEMIGKDCGVVIDRANLLNTLEASCGDEAICTRFAVSGGNDIGVTYVNFGDSRIEDFSYFMNARDERGKRIYVTDALADKYGQYAKDRELARTPWIDLTREYHAKLEEIDELTYRVPNDSLETKWETFSDEELEGSLTVYQNLLATLQSLYREDYGPQGLNDDGSIKEDFMKTTPYWHDYYAYVKTIEQINAALHVKDGETSEDTSPETLNAYKTEWSLYGSVELEQKLKDYDSSMKLLADDGKVFFSESTGKPLKWEQLSADQKATLGNIPSSYQYDAYKKLLDEKTACQAYLDNTLKPQIERLRAEADAAKEKRDKLKDQISLETYSHESLVTLLRSLSSEGSPSVHANPPCFDKNEIEMLHLLCIDKNYSNENILTTSLDTTVTEVDVQLELLEEAKKQLSIESQPQISFRADIENLLCMKEFEDFPFEIGNFVSVEYFNGYYVRLRLYDMTFNPCAPESSLSVSFTNYLRSSAERLDTSYILSQAVGSGSGGSSSGGGSSGAFGIGKDIDVTISNTMLAKLLNSEMFGTRVSNIILDTATVNQLTAKCAKFDGLQKGVTSIDGQCIKTGYIVDNNYNGENGEINNSKGSVINFNTGKISLGGGALKFEDTTGLSVTGKITADKGKISCWDITPDSLYRNNSQFGASNGIYLGTNGLSVSNIFKVTPDGTLSASGAEISGTINANNGKIACWNITSNSLFKPKSDTDTNDNIYLGVNGLTISDAFNVSANGTLTATKADISGKITAYQISADKAYYSYDVINEKKIFTKVIERKIYPDTDDTKKDIIREYRFGRLKMTDTLSTSSDDGSLPLNYIAFIDKKELDGETNTEQTVRICRINSDQLNVDGSIDAKDISAVDIFARDIYSDSSIHIASKGHGIKSKVGGWLIRYAASDKLGDIVAVGNPDQKTSIYGNGNIWKSGSNDTYFATAQTSSDRRLKEHISDLSGLSDFFMNLNPICYKYHDGIANTKSTKPLLRWGFYAQDLIEDFDSCGLDWQEYDLVVKETKDISTEEQKYLDDTCDGILKVSYQNFTALNTAMIQQAFAKIQELEEKIETLEQQLKEKELTS